MAAYADFVAYVAEINDLLCAMNLLAWDARTQMPPGGAATRGAQLATLTGIAQARITSDAFARLIDGAAADLTGADGDSYEVRAVASARAAHDLARRIPAALAVALAERKALAQRAWEEAKPANDFAHFAPHLSAMVELNRELADAIGYDEHPYDALLLQYEPDMTAARLTALFADLKAGILPLLDRIRQQDEPRSDFLYRSYPALQQRAFALEIARIFGYDLDRGRLDASAHPFEISFTRQDVRFTTRYQERYLPGAVFGVFHETGHALYEQGVDPALTRTALTTDFLGLYAVGGASYGTHESQSRLWENQVGRSRAFWQLHFPRLQEHFPDQLADVDAEQFYRAVNRVRPSLIRVEADEVTYNLHIMLRVEIEMGLLDGSIAVADLPEVWRAKADAYLGVTPPTDTEGVLQDIHWSSGHFGSFPTYTIGNVMAAQFMAAAQRDVAGLDDRLAAGDYAPLLAWLTENIYRHGRAFSPEELLVCTTGAPLSTGPYLAYLRTKFDDLYPPED
ncbi:MAG: carboxypeptidase M32 [Caldilineaceae bacterium]|nr:carboxypeptidase M32 [Caldilineaceae bacterium]